MTAETARLIKVLDLTEAEALELQAADKAIDRMAQSEVTNDLTADQRQAVKKACQADRAKNAKPSTRERKADNAKAHLMKLIEITIGYNPDVSDFELTNAERECVFYYDNRKFKITLSAPRS